VATPSTAAVIARDIQQSADDLLGPPAHGAMPNTQEILPRSLITHLKGRRYIPSLFRQINGTFERGWCDGCAVLIRRLVETLIIEAFDHHSLAASIQDSNGEFLGLDAVINEAISSQSLLLTRNCKRALPRVKKLGDQSAHSRFFNATPTDIRQIRDDVRLVVEELLHKTGL
jgi:hypothetical protein